MRKCGLFILAALLVACAASQIDAQQRGFGRGMMGGGAALLAQKSVQEELKLTPDQVKQGEELAAKQQEAFRGLADLSQEERRQKMQEMQRKSQEDLAQFLKPDQLKRFRQISLQQSFPQVLLVNDGLAGQLKLTDDQKEKLRTMQQEAMEEMRNAFQGGFNEETRKKMTELQKTNRDKAMNLLTAEQKTKWKELTGEPFKGEIQFGGRRGKQ
jgi:Spy/CpxP family protein refolding chaperone